MSEITVIVQPQETTVVELGLQGLQGPPGATVISGAIIPKTAGENLGGNRVVAIGTDGQAYYANQTNPEHTHKVLGITTGAVIIGESASIQTFGEMTEVSWNWDMTKPLFLGVNGLMTQTAPSSGFVLQLGIPLTPTSIFIDIGKSIVLV